MMSDNHERRGELSTGPVSCSARGFVEWEYVRGTSTLRHPHFRAGGAGPGPGGACALESQSGGDVEAGIQDGLRLPCPLPHSFQGSGDKGKGREFSFPASSAH